MWRQLKLLKLFFCYCFFRKGPADIPVNEVPSLFKTTIYGYIMAWMSVLITLEDPVAAVLQTAVGLAMTYTYVWLLLALSRRQSMFRQTAAAVTGVQSLFIAFALPWVLWIHVSDADEILIPFYTTVLIFLWLVAVIAYLLRQSLSTTTTSSSFLAVGYFTAVLGSAFALFA